MIAAKESHSNQSLQRTRKTPAFFVLALPRHFCTKTASISRAVEQQRYVLIPHHAIDPQDVQTYSMNKAIIRTHNMPKYQSLSISERIKLVEAMWDSIAIEADNIPITESQRLELDRRIDKLHGKGPDRISATDAIAEIRARL